MNEDDRLDLSALDPMQDPEHWQSVMAATLHRVDGVLARRAGDPLSTIADWTRPLLALAAVAVAILIPVELALETRETNVEQVRRLVSLSVERSPGADPPTGAEFLRALTADERP